MGATETWHAPPRFTECELDPVIARDAVDARGQDSAIASNAEGQPGPGAEFVLWEEHRSPVALGVDRYLRDREFETTDGVAAACRYPVDPGHHADVVLHEPVA